MNSIVHSKRTSSPDFQGLVPYPYQKRVSSFDVRSHMHSLQPHQPHALANSDSSHKKDFSESGGSVMLSTDGEAIYVDASSSMAEPFPQTQMRHQATVEAHSMDESFRWLLSAGTDFHGIFQNSQSALIEDSGESNTSPDRPTGVNQR